MYSQTTKDFFTPEEWPPPKLACVQIWRRFAELWLKMCNYGKVKVIRKGPWFVKSALHLLLLIKHRKFENDTIAILVKSQYRPL